MERHLLTEYGDDFLKAMDDIVARPRRAAPRPEPEVVPETGGENLRALLKMMGGPAA